MNQAPVQSIPVSSPKYAGRGVTFGMALAGLFLERFLFYGLRSVLALIMIDRMEDTATFSIYGAMGALMFLGALVMGMVGDLFFERRSSTTIGMLIFGIGMLCFFFYARWGFGSPLLGLSIAAVGSGLFRTNNLALLFNAFPFPHRKIIPAYLFYALVNLGGLLAPLILAPFFTQIGISWGPFIVGILALFWGGLLLLLQLLNFIRAEPEGFRSSLSRKTFSPWIGLGITILVCGAFTVLAALLTNFPDLTTGSLWLGSIPLILGIVVILILMGEARGRSILVLLVSALALAIFWASYEAVYGKLATLGESENQQYVYATTLTLTLIGCLVIGFLGIVIPIRGIVGELISGGSAAVGWLLGLGMLLALGTGALLTTVDLPSQTILLSLMAVVELLVVPALFLWSHLALSRAFQGVTFGLLMFVSYYSVPISQAITGDNFGSLDAVRDGALDFIPWFGGIGVLLLVTLVVSVIVGSREEKAGQEVV